jgi:hypothetical protein
MRLLLLVSAPQSWYTQALLHIHLQHAASVCMCIHILFCYVYTKYEAYLSYELVSNVKHVPVSRGLADANSKVTQQIFPKW